MLTPSPIPEMGSLGMDTCLCLSPTPSLGKLSHTASGRRFSGRNHLSVQCVK